MIPQKIQKGKNCYWSVNIQKDYKRFGILYNYN